MQKRTPQSQKADVRPISFTLQDGNSISTINLAIRPEELTRTEPSRMMVQQTLGGAAVDNFGPGITQISISGHTGWKPGIGSADDGMERFKKLNNSVFKNWHKRREDLIALGQDPDGVRLILTDALDDFVYIVAPMNFTLKRSKSRPLLMQFNITLLALGDSADPTKAFASPPAKLEMPSILKSSAITSILDSIKKIKGYSDELAGMIDKTIGQPVRDFNYLTADVLKTTTTLISAGADATSGLTDSLLSISTDLSQAGGNIMRTYSSITSIPANVKAKFMEIASAYGNAFCILRNAFRRRDEYDDYDSLYGSSYCSSTAGGRPLSQFRYENVFYRVTPVTASPAVSQTSQASTATKTLASADPLTLTPSASVIQTMQAITSGTSIKAAA